MDWLEVRLPQLVPFRPQVQELIEPLRRSNGSSLSKPYMKSEHYAVAVDLRERGIDAVLHLHKKRDEHTHKIQMVGVGQYSWEQHIADIEAIVDTDPLRLAPMRTDLTVDLENVPMSWVVEHSWVAGKRFTKEVGRINPAIIDADMTPDERETFLTMGSRSVETHVVGMKPNCFRVYNKTAERKAAYQKFVRDWHPAEPSFEKWMKQATTRVGLAYQQFEALCYRRGLHPDVELQKGREHVEAMRPLFDELHAIWAAKVAEKGPRPTFQKFCGLQPTTVLTRFERMIGAQQVRKLYRPEDKRKLPIFSSLRDLKDNVVEFNPFSPMTFTKPGRPEPELPNGSNYSLIEYMAGMWAREFIQRQSMQDFVRFATPLSSGHFNDRIMKSLQPFLPCEETGNVVNIDAAELYERYRNAMRKQLAA